jgi:hypothetical protein
VRRALFLAPLLILALASAPADASPGVVLKRFRVRDAGPAVEWSIDVCSARRRVRVSRLRAELISDNRGDEYVRRWRGGRSGPGCQRWIQRARDVWVADLWYSRLTVTLGDGHALRTLWVPFYMD